MGLTDALEGTRVYLDANVFIYALEGFPQYTPILGELFDALDAGLLQSATSELTVGEVLVKPFVDDNAELQATYEDALQNSSSLEIIPVSRQILIDAARLRATSESLRLPDAIHIATARGAGCRNLVTNDKRIRSLPEIHILQLADFIL